MNFELYTPNIGKRFQKTQMQGYFFTFKPSLRAQSIEYAAFMLKNHHIASIGTNFVQVVGNVIVVNFNPCVSADVCEAERNHFFDEIGQTFTVTPLYPWNHPQDAVAREAFARHYHNQVVKEQMEAIRYFGVPPPPELKRCEDISLIEDFDLLSLDTIWYGGVPPPPQLKRCEGSSLVDDLWPETFQESEGLKEWMAYVYQQDPGPPTIPFEEDGIYEPV